MLRELLLYFGAPLARFSLHLLGLADPLLNSFEKAISGRPMSLIHECARISSRTEFAHDAKALLLRVLQLAQVYSVLW